MTAQQHRMDAISNNLANVDTVGYKRDVAVNKAFPELLIRRMADDGIVQFPYRHQPIGSVDKSPVVGRLGTGVEHNETFTVFEQGPVQQTENPFDIALEGEGFLVVQTPVGERHTRNGSFILGSGGRLLTQQGYPVLGETGPISLQLNNFRIDQDGRIFANARYLDDPERLVLMQENEWDQPVEIGRLRLETVRETRYLQKQGENLWKTTWESGDAFPVEGDLRPAVLQGFLEKANVNPVTEMVRMIEVNRAYEANQKVVQAQDESTGRLLTSVARI